MMWRPTKPLAPVTPMITRRGCDSALGAHVLVEEYERLAARDDRGQRFVNLGIEHGAGQIGDALDGLLGSHLFLVGAGRGQRVIDLCRADNPPLDWDFVAA